MRIHDKPDPRIAKLDQLHERNSVKANIQLAEGRRIKLGDSEPIGKMNRPNNVKIKAKSKATFDMDFVDLSTNELGDICAVDLADLSDDDLPDVHEIVKGHIKSAESKNSSDCAYADSEVDGLIRNMPGSPDVTISATRQTSQVKEAVNMSHGLFPASFGRKRPLDNSNTSFKQAQDSLVAQKRRKVCFTFVISLVCHSDAVADRKRQKIKLAAVLIWVRRRSTYARGLRPCNRRRAVVWILQRRRICN